MRSPPANGASCRQRVRRLVIRSVAACAVAVALTGQEGEHIMAAAPPEDYARLQAYYEVETKYLTAPVPTPLDRDAAVDFVNRSVNRETSLDRMRKLMRLAVFYDLHETAAAFSTVLTGAEASPTDVSRAALSLVAIAWVGTAVQQSEAQQYFHALQTRADVELHREIMLEVVEAFGPREGTAAHRQWIQAAIRALEGALRREQEKKNVRGARLTEEKINALTEYMAIQLDRVDRTFSIRARIDGMGPSQQIPPLVDLAVGATAEATPPLTYWSSMRLLRFGAQLRGEIAAEFRQQGERVSASGQELFRARALRAAVYFGGSLSNSESGWLSGQEDPGIDPLVLRPNFYLTQATPA